MSYLGYGVTVFFRNGVVQGIAYCEINALKFAIQQIPAGAVLTGRITNRVAIDEDQHDEI